MNFLRFIARLIACTSEVFPASFAASFAFKRYSYFIVPSFVKALSPYNLFIYALTLPGFLTAFCIHLFAIVLTNNIIHHLGR